MNKFRITQISFALAFAILLGGALSGCVNSQLASARGRLAAGDYAAAHQDLLAAGQSGNLSGRERREVMDGLCLTESKLGAPTYSLAQQRQICALAVQQPGSTSASVLAQIDDAERSAAAAAVQSALARNDLADAEESVVSYQRSGGADPAAVAAWSREIWQAVERQDDLSKRAHRRTLAPAISAIARQYPRLRHMDDSAFTEWVIRNATVAGTSLLSAVALGSNSLDLSVPGNGLDKIAFNLNRLTRINDGLVARCRCDGRTNITVEGSGLPAYLVRLDPETRQSEVLILPRPQ